MASPGGPAWPGRQGRRPGQPWPAGHRGQAIGWPTRCAGVRPYGPGDPPGGAATGGGRQGHPWPSPRAGTPAVGTGLAPSLPAAGPPARAASQAVVPGPVHYGLPVPRPGLCPQPGRTGRRPGLPAAGCGQPHARLTGTWPAAGLGMPGLRPWLPAVAEPLPGCRMRAWRPPRAVARTVLGSRPASLAWPPGWPGWPRPGGRVGPSRGAATARRGPG